MLRDTNVNVKDVIMNGFLMKYLLPVQNVKPVVGMLNQRGKMPKGIKGFQKGHPYFSDGRTLFKKGNIGYWTDKKRPNLWKGKRLSLKGKHLSRAAFEKEVR